MWSSVSLKNRLSKPGNEYHWECEFTTNGLVTWAIRTLTPPTYSIQKFKCTVSWISLLFHTRFFISNARKLSTTYAPSPAFVFHFLYFIVEIISLVNSGRSVHDIFQSDHCRSTLGIHCNFPNVLKNPPATLN